MPEVISFNPEELTIGEMEEFEELAGMAWTDAFKETVNAEGKKEVHFPAKALVAMVCLIKRKDNPEFTIDDARKIKVSALEMESSDVPPTESNDSPS